MALPFALSTMRCTSETAYLRLLGELNVASAELICDLITTHVDAGRSRIRVDASHTSALPLTR